MGTIWRRLWPHSAHWQPIAKNGSAEPSQQNQTIVSLMASNTSIRKRLNTQFIVLLVGLILTSYNFYAIWRLEAQPAGAEPFTVSTTHTECSSPDKHITRPVVWIAGERVSNLNRTLRIEHNRKWNRYWNLARYRIFGSCHRYF